MPEISAPLNRSGTVDEKILSSYGIDSERLSRIYTRIESDIQDGLYPGASIALARKGRLLLNLQFGHARMASTRGPAVTADSQTLWLLYSQTKPIVACAVWILVERGLLNFHEPVSTYLKNFGKHGKSGITLFHLLTHQAGFPNASVPESAWEDPERLKETISNFELEWAPGTKVFYHALSAHWVLAALINEVSGMDFREFISDEITSPLGLKNIFIGANESIRHRLTENYERNPDGTHELPEFFNSESFMRSGTPGAGAYASAGDLCLFYQMLLKQGELAGKRILAPGTVKYVTRNHTGDRNDDFFGMPMHRALGVHLRGETTTIRGLGSTASPSSFGHGGVGSSYSVADPESGVSFSFISNSRLSEPYHSRRLEEIMCMMQSSITEL